MMRRNELPETNKRETVQRGGEEGKLKCENVFPDRGGGGGGGVLTVKHSNLRSALLFIGNKTAGVQNKNLKRVCKEGKNTKLCQISSTCCTRLLNC